MEGTPSGSPQGDQAREYAVDRLKARRDFISLVASAVIVSAFMVVIWLVAGSGYFWPIWVMAGFGIALLFGAWRAYGPGQGPITEEEIQREIDKQ